MLGGANPLPTALGIPYPAQVPTGAHSSRHLPGAAPATAAFAQSRVIHPGANSAGTGAVWVSGRPETGLRHSH